MILHVNYVQEAIYPITDQTNYNLIYKYNIFPKAIYNNQPACDYHMVKITMVNVSAKKDIAIYSLTHICSRWLYVVNRDMYTARGII